MQFPTNCHDMGDIDINGKCEQRDKGAKCWSNSEQNVLCECTIKYVGEFCEIKGN